MVMPRQLVLDFLSVSAIAVLTRTIKYGLYQVNKAAKSMVEQHRGQRSDIVAFICSQGYLYTAEYDYN